MSAPTPIPVPKGFQRLGPFPLDPTSVFASLADLTTYATSGTAYQGQICAVAETTGTRIFEIGTAGSLVELAPLASPIFTGKVEVEELTVFRNGEQLRFKSNGQIESDWGTAIDFEQHQVTTNIEGTPHLVLSWVEPAQLNVGNRTLKNLGAPTEENDAVRVTDLQSEAQARLDANEALQTQIDGKQPEGLYVKADLLIVSPRPEINGRFVPADPTQIVGNYAFQKVGSPLTSLYYNGELQRWQLVYNDDIAYINNSPFGDPLQIVPSSWLNFNTNPQTSATVTITAAQPQHKSAHATGGTDALTPADIGAQPAGSYATLVGGLVPAEQLPSYVDDVLEFADLAAFPAIGESAKIYVTLTTPPKAYRWSGSAYIEISPSEVTSVAGKTGAVTLGTADITGLSAALDSKQPTGNYVTRDQVQTGGSSYFERSANAASQNVGQGQSVHQIVLANDTRLTDARQALAHSHPTTDINSASVYFEITGSHPALEGFYDVWDIPNGRFRWANDNTNPDGAAWTALRWNDSTSRWELGTYTAFTTWTPLFFHASSAVIPPATGWVALPGITQPAPTLAWYSQTASEEITALHAEDARLQKTINDLSGSSTAAIQTLSTQTTNSLALKADLVSGLVPATQLPPLSYQTTRYDGDGTAFSFAPPGTLTASDSPSAILVTINGVTQEPGSDYTLNISTNRVVLTSALPLGDKIVITRPILLPSASTLTAEQLGALTATSVIDGGSF